MLCKPLPKSTHPFTPKVVPKFSITLPSEARTPEMNQVMTRSLPQGNLVNMQH
jgi:hypothetical protein